MKLLVCRCKAASTRANFPWQGRLARVDDKNIDNFSLSRKTCSCRWGFSSTRWFAKDCGQIYGRHLGSVRSSVVIERVQLNQIIISRTVALKQELGVPVTCSLTPCAKKENIYGNYLYVIILVLRIHYHWFSIFFWQLVSTISLPVKTFEFLRY